MYRRMIVAVALAALASLMWTQAASAVAPGLPPGNKILLGVGGTSTTPGTFKNLTGKRHHIYLVSLGWGQGRTWGRLFDAWLADSNSGNYRLMFHISTRNRSGGEAITPRKLSNGYGDTYLIAMSQAANNSNQFVYIRPMGEMNGYWNPWCAFNANGTRRNAAHTTLQFRRAFQRISLIMRGGDVASINQTLRSKDMPNLRTALVTLPRSGRVAMVWNPQGEGAPNVRGNQPPNYYPGKHYVDYVANDLYSIRFRAHWRAQNSLYNSFPGHPFMMAEYAPWGTDDPTFMNQMFRWALDHPRTRALIYFNGTGATTFRLSGKPRSLNRYKYWIRTRTRFRCDLCGATTNG